MKEAGTTMNDDDTAAADARFNRRFLAAFAAGLCLGAFAYVAAITFLPLPAENARFADTVLGFILGTVMATPIGFFYGSSKSSQAKDQALREQISPAQQPKEPPR